MKIRLIETAIPYSKVRKNVESIILPAISELGFTFSPYRTTNINAYETVYNGNYTDLNGNSTPISLRVNTPHQPLMLRQMSSLNYHLKFIILYKLLLGLVLLKYICCTNFKGTISDALERRL